MTDPTDQAERTLVIIKPDAVRKGAGAILDIMERYEKAGLTILDLLKLTLTEDLVKKFYQEHVGKPYWKDLSSFSQSGPVFAIILSGENAVQVVRDLNGATNPTKAAEGTIRRDYGSGNGGPTNAVHGSDSVESAEREIKLIFG